MPAAEGLPDAHSAEKIGERFAGLIGKCGPGALAGVDPVQAKIAKIHAELAPRGQGPDRAPEVKREGPDVAFALLFAVVGVGEAENGVVVDGCVQRFPHGVDFTVLVHRRDVDLRSLDFGAAAFGQGQDDLVQSRDGRVAEPVAREGLRHAQADDNRLDFIGSEHEGRQFERAVKPVADAGLALNGD